jgi:NTP pyrophosphatase (non-canonical NTP hydrolase)
MTQVDLQKYQQFVTALASKQTLNLILLEDQLKLLQFQETPNINISALIAASFGLSSETGEFNEIVKKALFQGKPINDENHFHLKRELGDVIWYWVLACYALRLDPNEVIAENVKKLEARYPGGTFDVHYSENRKEGDL